MKISISALLVFFLLSGNLFALGHRDPRETMHPKKSEYKLSKKEFMAMYGKDDSAKALINVFFRDRRIGFYVLPAYPIIAIINGLSVTKPNIGDITLGQTRMLSAVAGITSLAGGYFLLTSTRKELYKELKYYEITGHISDEYSTQVKGKLFRMNKACKVVPATTTPANGGTVPPSK